LDGVIAACEVSDSLLAGFEFRIDCLGSGWQGRQLRDLGLPLLQGLFSQLQS